MLRRVFFWAPLLIAIAAVVLSSWRTQPNERPPPIPGRNNTVLFITSEMTGLSNVHVAASFALLENHPSAEVHYASFPELEKKISHVSSAARARTPAAKPIVWHGLPGPNTQTSMLRYLGDFGGLIQRPGTADLAKKVRDLTSLLGGWTGEEHWALYEAMRDLVDEVDPAVVVFDHILLPAVDLAGNLNRRFVTVSPQMLSDVIAEHQPWLGVFWKYPATMTGFPFPVPWRLIPLNTWVPLRLIHGLLTDPMLKAKKAFLREKGIKNPMAVQVWPKGVPLLSTTIREANIPMDVMPAGFTLCGPIVLDTAPAAEQDAELAAWLGRGKGRTVLVNLGTMFRFDEPRARAMVGALAAVLEAATEARALLKFRCKPGEVDEEAVLEPLRRFVEEGRVRVESWLKVDPSSLLQTGDVDLFVHHGGSNGYHEAILAGVPQIILPLWYDLFNIARTAEYLGIGIWPGQDTTPEWQAETLADSILRGLVGAESQAMRDKARALRDIARGYGGRNTAAGEIAKLAALGEAR